MQGQDVLLVGALVMLLGLMGLIFIGLALWGRAHSRRLQSLPGKADGTVTGLLRVGLWDRRTMGEVPGGAVMGFSVAAGEQYGGHLSMRLFPWFPCVRYTVGGRDYVRVMGEGLPEGSWRVNQRVRVRYDTENPRISAIEGDPSYPLSFKVDLLLGLGLLILALAAGAVLVILA